MSDHAYSEEERDAVYKVMRERRDVRHGYLDTPIPDDVLTRVLGAGHLAASVGLVQPWDFLVLRSRETRSSVLELVLRWRAEYARSLPHARAKQFMTIKVEAILDTPLNIVVTADASRGGRHVLGARTQPYAAPQSTTLAIQNIWLAARAEGLGVNMMGFYDERELAEILDLPAQLEIVAYLCLGYVERFPPAAELELANWGRRRPLSWVIHHESYGQRGAPGKPATTLLDETIKAIALAPAEPQPPASRSATDIDESDAAVGDRLTALAGTYPPPVASPAAAAVFAADCSGSGHEQSDGGSAADRVAAIANGSDPIAKQAVKVGAELAVVDLGVASEEIIPGVTRRRLRSAEAIGVPASLTPGDLQSAVEAGIETARELVIGGNRSLAVTGTLRDREARSTALGALLASEADADALSLVVASGAVEEAAAAGFLLGAAAHRVPVITHGTFGEVAALLAGRFAPGAEAAWILLAPTSSADVNGPATLALRHEATTTPSAPETLVVSALVRLERITSQMHASASTPDGGG